MSAAASRYPACRAAGTRAGTGPAPGEPVGRWRRAARVRWDRLGRIALLGVLVALVYLYVSAALTCSPPGANRGTTALWCARSKRNTGCSSISTKGSAGRRRWNPTRASSDMTHRGGSTHIVSGHPDN